MGKHLQNPARNTVDSLLCVLAVQQQGVSFTSRKYFKIEICYLSLQVTISLAELVQVWRDNSAEADERLEWGQQWESCWAVGSSFAVTWSCPELECNRDTVVVYENPAMAHSPPAASVKHVYNRSSLMVLDVQMDFGLKKMGFWQKYWAWLPSRDTGHSVFRSLWNVLYHVEGCKPLSYSNCS